MAFWNNRETPFKSLDNAEELSRLFELSNEKPVIIFKHSNMCNISADAYREMESFDGEISLVVVQTARQISNEIETRTSIEHESPQVIILRNGKPVWHASHWSITKQSVSQALEQA